MMKVLTIVALVCLVMEPVLCQDGVWIIRMASHPYKTKLYTAEIISGVYLKKWCLDWVDANSALVLCRETLGNQGMVYNSTFPPEHGELIHEVSTGFMNTTFACVGTEERLRDCPRIQADPLCPSKQIGYVDCSYKDNYKKHFETSFVGSWLLDRGILKLRSRDYPSIEGMICDETGSWGRNEAKVACRSLGFYVDSHANARVTAISKGARLMFPHVDPRLKYVIKDVRCNGTESSLSDCHHREMCGAWDNYAGTQFFCADQCHGEDVGVVCPFA